MSLLTTLAFLLWDSQFSTSATLLPTTILISHPSFVFTRRVSECECVFCFVCIVSVLPTKYLLTSGVSKTPRTRSRKKETTFFCNCVSQTKWMNDWLTGCLPVWLFASVTLSRRWCWCRRFRCLHLSFCEKIRCNTVNVLGSQLVAYICEWVCRCVWFVCMLRVHRPWCSHTQCGGLRGRVLK